MRTSRLALVASLLLVTPIAAHAQTLGPGFLDQIVQRFTNGAAAMQNTTAVAGETLFAALVGIELVFSLWWAVAGNATLTDLLALAGKQIVTIGFCWWLMTNASMFFNAIVDTFAIVGRNASVAAGGVQVVSPTDVFSAGMNMAHVIWNGMSISSPGLSLLLVLTGLIVLWVFVQVAGMLIEVIIEAALVAYAGIFLVGFGGTSFTRDYAIAYFRFAIGVGVKRMLLQILVGVGTGWVTQLSNQLVAGTITDTNAVGAMVAISLIMLRLVEKLPYRAADLLSGSVSHGPGNLTSTAISLGAGVASAGVAAAGGGAAAVSAVRLASAQAGQQSGGVAPSGIGGRISQAAMIGGYAARNMGAAMANDIGMRLTGQGSRYGVAGFRMASGMNAQRNRLNNQGSGE